MDLKSAIEKRHSVRKFKETPVPVEVLRELVRRAGLAPSVNNSQPWHFISVTNKSVIDKMAEIVRKKIHQLFDKTGKDNIKKTVEHFSTIFENAPALIVVAGQPYQAIADAALNHDDINAIRHHPDIQSIGAAIENILLSAVDLGYGACWLSGLLIAQTELEELLNIKAPKQMAAAVAVGLPEGESRMRDKKSLDEIYTIVD